MSEIPPDIQARRTIEDEAIRIGQERAALSHRMTENTWTIIELLRRPEHALIPLDHLAQLLGVSRPSIYRWRETAEKIPPHRTVADWLSERDADGNLVNYRG